MSAFEDSYKSQLQGVSQQIARERLDGQVTAQENMLSDAVTNLRRRPGAAYAYDLSLPTATEDTILAWNTDLSGVQCHVVLNTANGQITILDALYSVLASLPACAYLTTNNTGNIQVATVGDEFFLLNTAKIPALGPPTNELASPNRGFFYVKAGAFGKSYDITVSTSTGSNTYTYITPSGANAGDAASSTPEAIAAKLAEYVDADVATDVFANVDGPYVYVGTVASNTLVLSTGAGNGHMIASGAGYVRQESDLPTRLPPDAHTYIVSTGDANAPRYYKYNKFKLAWLECGNYLAPTTLENMPVSVSKVDDVWTLDQSPFEGRLAGDDISNPNPPFAGRGITGMSNYQGRLVLLSGSYVNFSAATLPRRFYRSTVVSLLDSDAISVGAASASSAAYRYAVPFGKDLLLFSEKYQAVVPGYNTAITPRTASVLVTSTYESDMTSKPVPCGRTLMYAAPRSRDFFGLLEMAPSQALDASYTTYDSTAHLPKYMAGRCRFSVASPAANMVLFSPTNDRYALIVHEYTWQGEQKIQQAWHRWSFKYKVAAAYFAGQVIHVLFVKNGRLVACTIDPRSGSTTASADRLAKLDMSSFADVTDHVVAVPAWLSAFDPTCLPSLRLSVASGALAGEPVGCSEVGGTLRTDLSYPNGRVAVGFPFLSLVSPTPPMKKDSNGVKISSNKLTVLRFMLGTRDSSEYLVSIGDASAPAESSNETGTLYYSSPELALGVARTAGDSVAVIPARTNANSTSLVISTDGTGELNIVSLEFVARYNEKINRVRRN